MNYGTALRYIWRLLPLNVAKTIASSIISSRWDCYTTQFKLNNSKASECKIVPHALYCSSGSRITLSLYIGFQFPGESTSSWRP